VGGPGNQVLMDEHKLDLFEDDICGLLMRSRTKRPVTPRQIERLLEGFRELRETLTPKPPCELCCGTGVYAKSIYGPGMSGQITSACPRGCSLVLMNASEP
jgi:hypothetical protein